MKEWTLGDDLCRQDNLLDQITFNDIITAVKCNCDKVDRFHSQKPVESISCNADDRYVGFV